MSTRNNPRVNTILGNLLNTYDKVMVLKMFVDSNDIKLKDMYYNYALQHNNKLLNDPLYIDAGFDLFAPKEDNIYGEKDSVYGDLIPFFGSGITGEGNNPVNKLDLRVCCSAKMFLHSGKNYNTGYYMYPRSSLSKTQLRLANSTGIIDAGYRGHLIGMFDVVNIPMNKKQDTEPAYFGKKYERYLQICAPGLVPIIVDIVNTEQELGEETSRGSGGFGSTGS